MGTILRLIHLGQRSFRMDEGFVAQLVKQDLPVLIRGCFDNTVPIIFSIAVHGFYVLFGDSEFILSFLPFIAGSASIYVIYLIGKRYFSFETGIIAGFIMAISPYHIFISQELRPYSLLCLLSFTSIYLFFRVLEDPHEGFSTSGRTTRRNSVFNGFGNRYHLWVLLLICNIAIIYTHMTGWYIIVMENLVFFLYKNRRYYRNWIVIHLLFLLASVPIFVYSSSIVKYAVSPFETFISDISGLAALISRIKLLLMLIVYFTAGFYFRHIHIYFSDFFDHLPEIVILTSTYIVSLYCLLFGIYSIWKNLDMRKLLIFLLCIFSFILILIPGVYVIYLAVGATAFTLILAFGIVRMKSHVRYFALGGLLFISVFSLSKLYASPVSLYDAADYKYIAGYTQQNIGGDDIVYFGGCIQACHTWSYYYQDDTIYHYSGFSTDNFRLTMNYEMRDAFDLPEYLTSAKKLLDKFDHVWIVLRLNTNRSLENSIAYYYSDQELVFHARQPFFILAEIW